MSRIARWSSLLVCCLFIGVAFPVGAVPVVPPARFSIGVDEQIEGRVVFPGSLERLAAADARPADPSAPMQDFLIQLKEPTVEHYTSIKAWLEAQGLRVGEFRAQLPVSVGGTVDQISRTFQVEIVETFSAGKLVRWARTAASLPGRIAALVQSIFGLQPLPFQGSCQGGVARIGRRFAAGPLVSSPGASNFDRASTEEPVSAQLVRVPQQATFVPLSSPAEQPVACLQQPALLFRPASP